MNILGELRRRAHHIVGPVAGITLFGYFAYHVVQGDRGLIAWLKLSQQVETAQRQYDEILSQRMEFAQRVQILQPQSLDPDLLDERARTVLGLAHPDDIIIMNGAGSPGATRPAALDAAPKGVPVPLPSPSPRMDRRALDELINTTLQR